MAEHVSLTKDDLKEIVQTAISTAIEESKKPAPLTVQEESELEMAQQHRKDTAQGVRDEIEQKRRFQKVCSHEHTKREGGGTHCVWVKESDPVGSPGYILCQKCQARVRPESAPKKLDPLAIYDTALFNKLFQDCNEGEILGG